MFQRWRTEEYPSDQHDQQRVTCTQNTRRPRHHGCDRRQPFERQEQSMPQAPDDEIPAGAMPCTGEEKYDPQVSDSLPGAKAIAAERDVDVVAKPRRQGHVPASPEVLDRNRRVGMIEIFRKAEAEQA